MLIEKMYKKTKLLKRELKPIRKLKKTKHYTKKKHVIRKQTTESNFFKAFNKWLGL